MTLENIVAGVDQFLLRQYTRVACTWERTGHSKYVLTDMLDYSTAFSVMFYNACVPEPDLAPIPVRYVPSGQA